MNRKQVTTSPAIEELNTLIIDGIQEKKGNKILKIDLRKLYDAPTDFFIICEGNSNTQVKAIADSIIKTVREATGENPAHVEGGMNARWMLVDYFNTVIHIFYKETRNFYRLEDLWSDGQITTYDSEEK